MMEREDDVDSMSSYYKDFDDGPQICVVSIKFLANEVSNGFDVTLNPESNVLPPPDTRYSAI